MKRQEADGHGDPSKRPRTNERRSHRRSSHDEVPGPSHRQVAREEANRHDEFSAPPHRVHRHEERRRNSHEEVPGPSHRTPMREEGRGHGEHSRRDSRGRDEDRVDPREHGESRRRERSQDFRNPEGGGRPRVVPAREPSMERVDRRRYREGAYAGEGRHRPEDRGRHGEQEARAQREGGEDRGGRRRSVERDEDRGGGGFERGGPFRERPEGGREGPGARGRGGQGAGGRRGAPFRGARRGRGVGRERMETFDVVRSRGENLDKKAFDRSASEVTLYSNYFKVNTQPNFQIYHYRIDFDPPQDNTFTKKLLVREHGPSLGKYICDGDSLYTTHLLLPDPMVLYSTLQGSEGSVQLAIKKVAELSSTDPMYLQIFSIVIRKCQELLGLKIMGNDRHFFNPNLAISVPQHRLQLWPGYKTSMRNHERDILLGVDLLYKVIRTDNCLLLLHEMGFEKQRCERKLVGAVVVTDYNNRNYRIDSIDWEKTPLHKFDQGGQEVSYIDYYQRRYGRPISDSSQPLLISRPKARDLHRGMVQNILLIPELCRMTGYTEEARGNMRLMREIENYKPNDPVGRVRKVEDFVRSLMGNEDVRNELQSWDLSFDTQLVELKGHQFQKEEIVFGDGKIATPNDRYDWSVAHRDHPMVSSIDLKTWAIIVTHRDTNNVGQLVREMQNVAGQMKFNIGAPLETVRISSASSVEYAKAVDKLMNQYKDRLQMIVAILPNNSPELYNAVKKRTFLEFGVQSQCILTKNATHRQNLKSICTKLVIQMNAKLGGEPWMVKVPITKSFMVVGFDVHHSGNRRGLSVCAMVASTCGSLSKYFSTVSQPISRDNLSPNMCSDFTKCLLAYYNANGNALPERIIMYRGGVGSGQLAYVNDTELKGIQESIKGVYFNQQQPPPKFTFIVVTRNSLTRIFTDDRGTKANPKPGTVAADFITLPERFDFFLVSQHSMRGTVSPVSYNVLQDESGFKPYHIQRLTFKLCHLYYNWSGTVAVPAPCQYAKKLAYQAGTALEGGSQINERLSNSLYYL